MGGGTQEKGKKKKRKKNEFSPHPSRPPPKLPKISVVNKSQNEEEAFELRNMRNIINHNDDFNERTNTLLYKNISHPLFSKGLTLAVCERWVGDGDMLQYWPSSTSFSSWLGCSTVGHWRPKALCLPLALNSASCLQLTPTDSNRLGHLVI